MIQDTSRVPPTNRRRSTPSRSVDTGFWRALSEADTPEDLYDSWLKLQCQLIDGTTDGVLVLGGRDNGRFVPVATWPTGRRLPSQVAEAAQQALSEGKGIIARSDSRSPLPHGSSGSFLLAHPVSVGGRSCGVAALGVRNWQESDVSQALVQLSRGCAWLEGLIARQVDGATDNAGSGTEHANRPDRRRELLHLVATFLQEERFQAAATAFVTELRTLLRCDRVSVGFVHRRRVVLCAMSHSAEFGKKTNLVRALESAMDEALDQEATVLFPRSEEAQGQDFRITRAHAEYSRQHGSAWICSVPLGMGEKIVGVLSLESAEDHSSANEALDLCETLGALVGPIFELKRRDDRWLLIKAVDAFRECARRVFGPRHVGWKIAAAACVAVLLFFAIARDDYRVKAKTVLEGEIQRAAAAPVSGVISAAPLRAGDVVQEGDVLCVLDDRDLRLQEEKFRSQLEQIEKRYRQAMADREPAQVKIFATQMQQVRAELERVMEQLDRMTVKAPFEGVIVSGDLSQSIDAPVERGDVLFEIAPLNRFRVLQHVDERDIRDVKVGQSGNLVLAAFPSESFTFEVSKITPVSTAEEGQNYFRVEAEMQDAPDRLRPGMEGVSKILVDRRHLIWIWTHRAVDWLRLKLWSWLP